MKGLGLADEDQLPPAGVAAAALVLVAGAGCDTATRTASRSLNEPDVATWSPAARPSTISTSSPTLAPTLTGRTCARSCFCASGASTNTWSPLGPLRSAVAGIDTTRFAAPTP